MPAISGCPNLVGNLVFEGSELISPFLHFTGESILRSDSGNQLTGDLEELGKGTKLENGFVISLRGDPLRPNPAQR